MTTTMEMRRRTLHLPRLSPRKRMRTARKRRKRARKRRHWFAKC